MRICRRDKWKNTKRSKSHLSLIVRKLRTNVVSPEIFREIGICLHEYIFTVKFKQMSFVFLDKLILAEIWIWKRSFTLFDTVLIERFIIIFRTTDVDDNRSVTSTARKVLIKSFKTLDHWKTVQRLGHTD